MFVPQMITTKPIFRSVIIDSKENYKQLEKELRSCEKFVFRGQKDYLWPITSSQERYIEHFRILENKVKENYESYCLTTVKSKLQDILKTETELKKKMNLENVSDFFAFLQHYGAPTRLIDFSRDFNIAAYFAVEPNNTDSSVFALDTAIFSKAQIKQKKLKHGGNQFSQHGESIFESCINRDRSYYNLPFGILDLQAKFTRLKAQKGVFLYPTDFSKFFQENLFGLKGDRQLNKPQDIDARLWKPIEIENLSKDLSDYQKNKVNIQKKGKIKYESDSKRISQSNFQNKDISDTVKVRKLNIENSKKANNDNSKKEIIINQTMNYMILKIRIKEDCKYAIYKYLTKKKRISLEELYPMQDELSANVDGIFKDLYYKLYYKNLEGQNSD